MPNEARVALITGCGKPVGIGNSTARALAAAGVTVVVSDLSPAGVANEHNVQGDMDPNWTGIDSLVEAIVKAGGTASATLGNVSVEADAARMVDEVLRRYGRLDILVNNAGAPQGADRNEIEDVPVAAWDLTMGVNARGCFLMSRAAVPAMRNAGWGRIVSVSSRAAFRPGCEAHRLCGVEGGDRRLHQIARVRSGAVRHHGECGAAGTDPHLACDQHQPARIRRRPGSGVPRARQGHSGRALRHLRTRWRR